MPNLLPLINRINMNRFVYTFISLFVCISLFAQYPNEDDARYWINRFDVKKKIAQIPRGNAKLFWDTLEKNNKRVQKLIKAIDANKKSLIKVMDDMEVGLRYLDYYDDLYPVDYELLQRLAHDLGIQEETAKYPIKVINDPTLNASMDPRGQMRINYGTINRLSYGELLAVCAHEKAHGSCEHVIDAAWKAEKRRIRNETWAGIGYGLMMGAVAYAGADVQDSQARSSVDNFISNAGVIWESFENEAHKATIHFKFRYSREQEIEADIIAYRFMEYMGYDTKDMLNLMRILSNLEGNVKPTKNDDHPSAKFRLQIIEMLHSGYAGKK